MKHSQWANALPQALKGGAVLACAAIVGFTTAQPAGADEFRTEFARYHSPKPPIVTVHDITSLAEDHEFDEPISGAATITRTKRSVSFEFNTADLEPNAPYTMWWVTFNRPHRCLEPHACALIDLSDPRVDAGVFFAGGRMTDAYGQADFTGEIDYGELPKGNDQIPFPGIEAPIKRGAEIHLVVRAHGPALDDPQALRAQLTEFNGGCPPNDGCVDVQVSVHPSPYARKRWRR